MHYGQSGRYCPNLVAISFEELGDYLEFLLSAQSTSSRGILVMPYSVLLQDIFAMDEGVRGIDCPEIVEGDAAPGGNLTKICLQHSVVL